MVFFLPGPRSIADMFLTGIPFFQNSCVDDKNPSAKRSGLKYKFELEKKDARCVDEKDRHYEYGEFKKVKVRQQ